VDVGPAEGGELKGSLECRRSVGEQDGEKKGLKLQDWETSIRGGGKMEID